MFTVYLFLEVEKKKTHESQMYELWSPLEFDFSADYRLKDRL